MTGTTRQLSGAAAAALGVLMLIAAGCSGTPTPYQPLGDEGGFEETQLQEKVFRVSFKGNRYTRETDVMDFLFLRCAELTIKNGYTHFAIQEDYGRTGVDLQKRHTGTSFGFGFGHTQSRSFWGMGIGVGEPDVYSPVISYHLAVFVIRMYTPEEAQALGEKVFQADFVIRSLTPKKEQSLRKE